jgi:DNA repair ATPase RecN
VFHEMGPDGEDAVFAFLQNKLKDWHTSLSSYKPLADTGNYPGKDEIADGLALVRKLLACDTSYKFIEQFNRQKDEVRDLADQFAELQDFYERQKPTWEKLRKASDRFQLNRLELARDPQAGPALRRMQEILQAASPYGLIKEADGLINTVSTVNTTLVSAAHEQALEKIDGYIATLTHEVEAAKGDTTLRSACLKPLELLRNQVETGDSLAHITQAAAEALKAVDAAVSCIEDYVKRVSEETKSTAYKKQRIIEPAKLVKTAYLETIEEINAFLDSLRRELEHAIQQKERVQIR